MPESSHRTQLALEHPISQVDRPRVEKAIREILLAIGENPDREGLLDTPARVARFYEEFIGHNPGRVDTAFQPIETDQMIIVRGITGWSLCEHHMLPFSIKAAVGYIAEKRILGLSKIARIVQKHAHRLQIQERLVQGVADEIQALTGAHSVAVVVSGQHLCCTMRGIKNPAKMVTSAMRGEFRDDPRARAEFLSLAEV